ncbi:hypothetical protein ATANTOWER_010316 [Ataeniobius toweri]|uniref:B30.2/SPRY domain-containing protein n=1 Tax=Ataeniobius toweri TaxID=208326 RepID=A0ABU7A5G8_9TELE|nr:hypothetical protein [Ataeniobius toweri]
MDLKRTRTRLDQILKSWVNHQEQLLKSISIILGALNNTSTKKADKKGHLEIVRPKRADASEREIKLNDKRFEKLLKTLYSISKNLKAQLQRKTALLDSYPTVIDKQTCHSYATCLSYWEVDVRCYTAWAVGVVYGSLQRKGQDKDVKLGRNRNSWYMELKNRHLSAWHNDRHVACQGAGLTLPGRVGVWVNYDKGQLMFHDADRMIVPQKVFSSNDSSA